MQFRVLEAIIACTASLTVPLALSGCGGTDTSGTQMPAQASQISEITLSGTAQFKDGSPVSLESIQYQLLLRGTNLFPASPGTCVTGDPQTPGLAQGTVNSDATGRFSVSLPIEAAHAVTQSGCKLASLSPLQLNGLRLDLFIPADNRTCPSFCSARGVNAALTCVTDCAAGTRMIIASKTLAAADVTALMSASPAGTLFWPLAPDTAFQTLGPPLTGSGVDLQVDGKQASDSVSILTRTFAATDCALAESCVRAPGTRRLLEFNGAIMNTGGANLDLGNPVGNPLFEYSACHNHYHLKDIMLYELLTPITLQPVLVGAGANTQSVVSRKQGFCMIDESPIRSDAGQATYTDCSNQGISAGWEDIYDTGLDCQWLDITDVPSGNYILRITVNPDSTFSESDTSNDSTDVSVTIP